MIGVLPTPSQPRGCHVAAVQEGGLGRGNVLRWSLHLPHTAVRAHTVRLAPRALALWRVQRRRFIHRRGGSVLSGVEFGPRSAGLSSAECGLEAAWALDGWLGRGAGGWTNHRLTTTGNGGCWVRGYDPSIPTQMRANVPHIVFSPRAYLLFKTASECAGKAMLRGVGGPWRRHGLINAPTRQTWCSKRTIQGACPKEMIDGPCAGLTTCIAGDGPRCSAIDLGGGRSWPAAGDFVKPERPSRLCMHARGGWEAAHHISFLDSIFYIDSLALGGLVRQRDGGHGPLRRTWFPPGIPVGGRHGRLWLVG